MAGAPSRCCHNRFKLRVALYSPQSQTASGTTTANARYSSSSTHRRPIGETVVVSRMEARYGAMAPSINDTAATWAVHRGYAAAVATRTVPTGANRKPGNRGWPVRNDPSAPPIAPNAAEAEKAAVKLVSQAWARIALVFRRCGPDSAVDGDSRASVTDSGADASTNANDMAVTAAQKPCSGIAAIVATMAAVVPVAANVNSAGNTTA